MHHQLNTNYYKLRLNINQPDKFGDFMTTVLGVTKIEGRGKIPPPRVNCVEQISRVKQIKTRQRTPSFYYFMPQPRYQQCKQTEFHDGVSQTSLNMVKHDK